MAAFIENLGSEPSQRHTIVLNDSELILSLRFLNSIERWVFDVEYKGVKIYNKPLAVGTLHIDSYNLPFDFAVEDTSGSGIDPFRLTDFADGRCNIVLLDADDMASIRGYRVEV